VLFSGALRRVVDHRRALADAGVHPLALELAARAERVGCAQARGGLVVDRDAVGGHPLREGQRPAALCCGGLQRLGQLPRCAQGLQPGHADVRRQAAQRVQHGHVAPHGVGTQVSAPL